MALKFAVGGPSQVGEEAKACTENRLQPLPPLLGRARVRREPNLTLPVLAHADGARAVYSNACASRSPAAPVHSPSYVATSKRASQPRPPVSYKAIL